MAELEPVIFDHQTEYRRLVENMPVMLWTADAGGQWTHVNRSWVDYTGLIGESAGFGFEQALHPDDVAPTLKVWRRAIATEAAYNIEYRLRDKGGYYRWFVVRGRRLGHDIDRSISWVGSCSDINDQKLAEHEARSMQRTGPPASLLHVIQNHQGDWRAGGRWWLDEPCRDCWLVHTGSNTTELHHEDAEHGRWWLARIQD